MQWKQIFVSLFLGACFGFWLGIVLTTTALHDRFVVHEFHEVYPSPMVFPEGKRSAPGRFSPQTIYEIETNAERQTR
jgi:hypothetical protein